MPDLFWKSYSNLVMGSSYSKAFYRSVLQVDYVRCLLQQQFILPLHPQQENILIWGYHDFVLFTNHTFLGFRCNTSDSISSWCSLRSRVFLWQRHWKYTTLLFSHSVSSETVVSHSKTSSRPLINITQNRTKERLSQSFTWYSLSDSEYSKSISYVFFFSSCRSFK